MNTSTFISHHLFVAAAGQHPAPKPRPVVRSHSSQPLMDKALSVTLEVLHGDGDVDLSQVRPARVDSRPVSI